MNLSSHRPLRREDLTSLQERLELLLPVRAGLVVVVAALAGAAPGELAARGPEVLAACLVYLAVAAAAEVVSRREPPMRLRLHRVLVPLDAAFLAWVVVGRGELEPSVLLLAVPLVAVTLLASVRSGLRTLGWETMFVLLAHLGPVAAGLGRLRPQPRPASSPDAGAFVALVVLWALGACAAGFSTVSERELRRSAGELDALTAMATDMETCRGVADILVALLTGLGAGFPLQRAVAVWDDGAVVSVCFDDRGPAGPELRSEDVAPGWADQVATEAWESRAPQARRRLSPSADPVLDRLLPGAERVVVLPLGPDGERRGAVVVAPAGRLRARLAASSLAALGRFAIHATLVLRNAALSAEQTRLAQRDGLTGLVNRRAFDAALAAAVERAEGTGQPVSLVVIDVDHFKAVNDRLGHQAGDRVLQEVAKVLRDSVRDTDVAARYGGEEFALILPRCGPDNALVVADSVRAAVGSWPALDGLTVSAGVAGLPADAGDADSLVRLADAALYQAKTAGRNRVVAARALTDAPPGGVSRAAG